VFSCPVTKPKSDSDVSDNVGELFADVLLIFVPCEDAPRECAVTPRGGVME
jgi:hypothetical protein